jgi:hypothetical protein
VVSARLWEGTTANGIACHAFITKLAVCMRVVLESTSTVVPLQTATGVVPARLWEGTTANGIICHAFITRIAVSNDEDASQFERELQEHRAPSVALDGVDDLRRLVL